MKRMNRWVLLLGVLGLSATGVRAAVKLPAIISDNMVLQKASSVPVWGWASSGEKVRVHIAGSQATAVADEQGRWRVNLNLASKGPGPYAMTVEGQNQLVVKNVLVGEVWLCSGQSNMEWLLRNVTDAETEIANSANPMLRHFAVTKKTALIPETDCEGRWEEAAPIAASNFTAVGYFFGRELQRRLKAPVGLINSSWGGTPAEAWTSLAGLSKDPDLKEMMDGQIAAMTGYEAEQKKYVEAMCAWMDAHGRSAPVSAEAVTAFAGPEVDVTGWRTGTLPASWQKLGIKGDGVVWFRRDVEIPEGRRGRDMPLELGVIHDFDTVYVQGEKVGASDVHCDDVRNLSRVYSVPGRLLKDARVTIAVRVVSQYGGGGMLPARYPMRLGMQTLEGAWYYKVEKEFMPLAPMAAQARPQPVWKPKPHNTSTYLYNGMLHPLVPYAVAGAIWYQGESNSGRAYEYRKLFPTMISDWRQIWGRPFSFYFCQLANFMEKKSAPEESAWAELREAQSMTLCVPRTGQAVLIDIGEAADIHPRNKQDVGKRLALIALAKDYRQRVVYSGPVYTSMKVEGARIRLRFDQVGGGLVAHTLPATYVLSSDKKTTAPLTLNRPGSSLQGFAVCGADRQWKWADAVIDGRTVVVSSPEVPAPVAVRYGWANNPTCNLYNKEGLPASPFRTDDFPGVTFDKKWQRP